MKNENGRTGTKCMGGCRLVEDWIARGYYLTGSRLFLHHKSEEEEEVGQKRGRSWLGRQAWHPKETRRFNF